MGLIKTSGGIGGGFSLIGRGAGKGHGQGKVGGTGNGSSPIGGPPDPNFADVAVLLKGAAFTDSGPSHFTVTPGSTPPTLETTITKWGSGSYKFTRNANCNLTITADLGFANAVTPALCIEWWQYVPASATTAAANAAFALSAASSTHTILGARDSGANTNREFFNVYTPSGTGGFSTAVATDTWQHMCLRRTSLSSMRCTLNGVHVATFNLMTTNSNLFGTCTLKLGANSLTGFGAVTGDMYIEDFRISRINRYTSTASQVDFSPPTATFPTR